MKVKLFRVFCICAGILAFALSNIQAQVIESVSYTPAKAGKYKDIASKSLTTFAGNVNVGQIVGRGETLTADLSSNSITLTSPAKLKAGQNLYLYLPTASNSKINSVDIGPDGNLYTTAANSSIDYMVAGKEISGNSVDFSKVDAVLGTNGKIDLNGIEMANPHCAIKWVKMPAFTTAQNTSSSPSSYWFAYCDYNPCSNGQYYCDGSCVACPCNKVNLGTEASPQCFKLDSELHTNLRTISTCFAGWNGEVEIGAGDPSTNKCKYANDNAFSSKFKCTNQVVKVCSGVGVYNYPLASSVTLMQNYAKTCKDRATYTSAYIGPVPAFKNMCSLGGGNFASVASTASFNNEITSGEYVMSMSASAPTNTSALPNVMGCIRGGASNGMYAIGQATEQNILDRNIGLRKMFCGFWGETDAEANEDINNMLNSSYNYSCGGTEYKTSDNTLHFCQDLYSDFSTNSEDAKEMCLSIRLNNSTIGNNFSCFLKRKDKNYKAFRTYSCEAQGVSGSETITYCNSTGGCRMPSNSTACHSTQNDKTYSVVKKVRPWCSLTEGVFKDCEEYLTCNSETLKSQRAGSTNTVYLQQIEYADRMLSCSFANN